MNAGGVAARPLDLTRNVGGRRSDRIVARRFNDRVVVSGTHERLLGGPEACADQHAMGPEHHGCRQTASVANAAGRQQMCLGSVRGKEIGCFRHEAHCSAQRAVPAGFGALSDNDISLYVDSVPDMVDVLALTNELCTGFADLIGEGTGITERQHYRGRSMFQDSGHQRGGLSQRPRNEADADPFPARRLELFFQPGRVAIRRRRSIESPGPAHRSSQCATAGERHRRRGGSGCWIRSAFVRRLVSLDMGLPPAAVPTLNPLGAPRAGQPQGRTGLQPMFAAA